MKAVVLYGQHDIRLETDWPEPPPPGPGEVTIEVSWCGVCGTDIEGWQFGLGIFPVDEPHPLTGRKTPLVLGHEFSGRIARLGEGADGLRIGQPVASEVVVACGACHYCQRHYFSLCPQTGAIGMSSDGAFARFVNMPAHNAFPLPAGFPEDIAALAEPVAVGVHAARRGGIRPGHRVLVIGAGPIGLACLAVARIAGASDVYVAELNPRRLRVARDLGATEAFDGDDAGWPDALLDLTGGRGADVVLETGASAVSFAAGLRSTAPGGRLVVVSVPREPYVVDALDLFQKEKQIVGSVSHTYDEDFRTAVKYLVDGRIDVRPLVTRHIHLDDAITRGFEALVEDKDEIKILVTPHDDWELPETPAAPGLVQQ